MNKMSMSCRDICLIKLDLRHRHLPELMKHLNLGQAERGSDPLRKKHDGPVGVRVVEVRSEE